MCANYLAAECSGKFLGLATAVVASMSTIIGGGATAQADVVPYVPWSSQPPGWTDQLVSGTGDLLLGMNARTIRAPPKF